MAKSKHKRLLHGVQGSKPSKIPKVVSPTTPPPDSLKEPRSLYDLNLTEDDLEIATETLEALANNPAIIKTKVCKDLRTAAFQFRNACTTGFNAASDSNLTSRISGALADEQYVEAQILLAEMRIRGQSPKLGALCRWVRDLDVVSGLAEQVSEMGARRSPKETRALQVLDAILRVVGPVDYATQALTDVHQPLAPQKPWDLRDNIPRSQTYAQVLDHSIFTTGEDTSSRFRIIEITAGSQRKPPNLHPAILYASEIDAVPFSAKSPVTTHHIHPIVPNLHLLKDVLTSEECDRIISAAESLGFTPDAPIRAPGQESSILAHNFYWIVDTAFSARLWERVERFVPANVHGKQVRGINRRFRVYRYVPGAEYRAHIDGAWPPSSIDPSTDRYIYDASPPEKKQTSLFTFLVYLNDEFDAGETTFFLPSAREGTMNAYPVKPIKGSVAMFPHGETEGSLLHEGTGVRHSTVPSAKYVIRTDVLYDVSESS